MRTTLTVVPRAVKAEILECARDSAKIIFRDPIPAGKYNLVVITHCGESRDYKLRRIGHPIRVVH